MGKTRTALAGGAWKLLRLALFWARKGGLFKRRLLQDLRLVMHNHIKSLRITKRSDMIRAGEREFSLDETPIFHFKTSSRGRSARMLHIPCINPPVDFDDEDFLFDRRRRTSCHQWSGALYEGGGGDDDAEEEGGDTSEVIVIAGDGLAHEGSLAMRGREEVEEEEEGIDVQAEEFIAKFYEQMKLQRQISLLQYNEMLIRSTN